MNVSSLTPWLSDFLTVRFSGSSGYFLFLNLLLSFFWLCKEAECICFQISFDLPSKEVMKTVDFSEFWIRDADLY